ncbi:MAG: hypothetical protein C7B45_04110 [Sulfobacillus acidophilus]|uniref:DUF4013 domain-containing protein n=1 Tax=Sulfobacillus acidophilus TaxID=53633 RepID=A0A2T2WLL8_9FIRM|nr:MAG: hypothetical protein C7B45_04110 [Sulfobacillus acidophilus]
MGLIRDSWRELWARNRGGGFLTLAFWYTLVITLYQYLVASRLGPALPKSLTDMVTHPGSVTTLPHLSSALWIKLVLVYVTFLIIILPYVVGGLYGGIAAAIRERPQFTGFLAFFRFGYVNFWRALGQILLAIAYAVIVMAVLAGVVIGLSALDGQSTALGILAVIIVIVGVLWMIGTLLYWFGFTFSLEETPMHGWIPALRWSTSHMGRLFGHIVLLMGLLLAGILVMTLIAELIPIIGTIISVLALGMVLPAFLATYAVLLYQEFPFA